MAGKGQGRWDKETGRVDKSEMGVRVVDGLEQALTQSTGQRKEGGQPAKNGMGKPAAPSDWG
jgi:hypothetical protein